MANWASGLLNAALALMMGLAVVGLVAMTGYLMFLSITHPPPAPTPPQQHVMSDGTLCVTYRGEMTCEWKSR